MHIVGHAFCNFDRIAGAFNELFNLIFLFNIFFRRFELESKNVRRNRRALLRGPSEIVFEISTVKFC